MARPQTNNHKNDFDPASLLQNIEGHAADINELKTRILSLENKFGDSIKIANTLAEAAKESQKMHEMLTQSFLRLLSNDPKVKNVILTILNQNDKKTFYALIKKIGFVAWTALVAILSGIATTLIQHAIK